MKTVKNAKRVALRSYSMWANYLGIAALIAPELIFLALGVDTNPRLWWILGLGLILAGILGRLVDQGMMRSPSTVMAAALLLAMAQLPEPRAHAADYTEAEVMQIAVPLIARWEGLRTEAYQDIVGVWTVCYGETKGVGPGDRYSRAECRAMLAREVAAYRRGWLGHVAAAAPLRAPREAAFTSLAYNVGVSAAGGSTATRRLNNGNVPGACTAIGWWNRAGDRVVRGLVNRRAEEVALCRAGLS
jgi:GH24 family phage-related lysozyme (muramidase)